MCMVYLDENIREKKSILIKMTQVNRNREKKMMTNWVLESKADDRSGWRWVLEECVLVRDDDRQELQREGEAKMREKNSWVLSLNFLIRQGSEKKKMKDLPGFFICKNH